MINVLEGYAAICIDHDKKLWIGVIQGNVYCKKTRESSTKALKDAKILFKSNILKWQK